MDLQEKNLSKLKKISTSTSGKEYGISPCYCILNLTNYLKLFFGVYSHSQNEIQKLLLRTRQERRRQHSR